MRAALLVLTILAPAWVWIGLRMSGAPIVLVAPAILFSLVLLVLCWRASGTVPPRGRHVGKVVRLWTTIEIVALVIVANLLEYVHRGDLLFPATAIIVGLHFFPLARGIPVRFYHVTGAGFVLTGLVAILLPAAERPIVVGLSAAAILWGTALVFIVRTRQPAPA